MAELRANQSASQRKGVSDRLALGYSVRRRHVDGFYFDRVRQLPRGSRVLDLGGHRDSKRGQFDIRAFPLRTVTANISMIKGCDVISDALSVAFLDRTFDAVVCAELLEHVPDPQRVLAEVRRVLRPGGTLLLTVPFLYRIHGDPDDFQRFAPSGLRQMLATAGFDDIHLEHQGLFWSVLVDMLRDRANERQKAGKPHSRLMRSLTRRLVAWGLKTASRWDKALASDPNPVNQAYTTGFGVVAVRAKEDA